VQPWRNGGFLWMKAVDVIAAGVRNLFPGYFAVAMATGIDSVAAFLLGWRSIGLALFYANVAAYCVLCLLTLGRLFGYFPRFIADVTSHARGPGFQTTVAATSILGSQLIFLEDDLPAGFFLWLVALAMWLLLVYTFFTAVIICARKPDLERGLHGGWLVVVVATQSIAVLGTLVASNSVLPDNTVLFIALAMYLLGCALYLLIISLIFYRLIFITLTPQEFAPDYWVNMGAVAITTLSGAALILRAPAWAFLDSILPFLKGFTLFFWVVATWWLPLLVILEFWRHGSRHFPIRYDPRYWDIVFPLGMYTACTLELGRVLALPFLEMIPQYVILIALASWVLVFLWMVSHLWRGLAAPAKPGH
jgi:tellurite resistance protein TehA-like permease